MEPLQMNKGKGRERETEGSHVFSSQEGTVAFNPRHHQDRFHSVSVFVFFCSSLNVFLRHFSVPFSFC